MMGIAGRILSQRVDRGQAQPAQVYSGLQKLGENNIPTPDVKSKRGIGA
jgi:hypothetical protein